jgi:rare lipoprotein A
MKIRSFSAIFWLTFVVLAAPFAANSTPIFSENATFAKEEYGIASYYADAFHGKKTANGEKYDMYDLTCAHKSFPFGTMLRVTRLDNNKSITVRVNDRGPYAKGHVIDLSLKAANKIDLVKIGITKVKIEVVGKTDSKEYATEPIEYSSENRPAIAVPASKPIEIERPTLKPMPAEKPAKIEEKKAKKVESIEKATPETAAFAKVTGTNFKQFDLYKIEITRPKKTGFGVQVSTLSNAENVFLTVAKLQDKYDNILMSIEPGEGDKVNYKIIVGPFSEKKKAESAQKSLKKAGYKGFLIDLKE